MVFVFEGRKLPFRSITEDFYAGQCAALLGAARDGDAALVREHLDGLPLWDRCMALAVLPTVQSRRAAGAEPPLDVDDVVLALKIGRALDELEVALDHVAAVRAEASSSHDRSSRRRGKNGGAPDTRTAEEIMMEELLRERCGPGFLPSSSSSSSDAGDGADEEPSDGATGKRAAAATDDDDDDGRAGDLAMCFDGEGNSVGIGSAAVFGAHGYHADK